MSDINPENLNKKERYELKHEEKAERKERAMWRKRTKKILAGSFLVLGLGAFIGWLATRPSLPPKVADITKTCVQHGRLGMHIHPVLRIVVNGKDITIPANIGIPSSSCMRPVHTHDETGTLHIESKEVRDFQLKEFFAVWGKPFNRDQILDYKVDGKHRIRVTINGNENDEFENLIMRDKDKIELRYE